MELKMTATRILLCLIVLGFFVSACTGPEADGAAAVTAATSPTPIASIVGVQTSLDGNIAGQMIQVIGIVESVAGSTMLVNGLTVDFANALIDGLLITGATVQIQGSQFQDGMVTAESIWVLQPPAPTPTTEVAADTIPFVIEGPVQAISGNRIRIHGFDLQVDDDPRLLMLLVGDVVRILGDVANDSLDDLFNDNIDDDINDDNYVTISNTEFGFLSNEIYASDDGLVWRDSGNCADAPPGWATATSWRSRCSGEFGGGPPAVNAGGNGSSGVDAAGSSSAGGNGSSGAGGNGSSGAGGNGSSGAGGNGSSGAGGNGSSGAGGNDSSGSGSGNPPPPPPPPPPAGGGGDSNSGSGSGSGSGS